MRKTVIFLGTILFTLLTPVAAWADDGEHIPQLYASGWALLPPIVAIALALITKEVYSSMLLGICVGALLWSDGNAESAVLHAFPQGVVAVLTDAGHVGIIIFDVVLGAMIVMMSRSGGSAAFGRWAMAHIKTRVGAQLATIVLGVFIFVDDYFNCLAVGSVMRPVTDGHRVSRAKLAYLVDATAAPICIIAPISTWAAAVSGFVEGRNGFEVFISTIPYNFYALLTLAFMVALVVSRTDYGLMAKHEANAARGDLFTSGTKVFDDEELADNPRGRVIDLLLPVIMLIIFSMIGMVYTGGFFSGVGLAEAFAGANAPTGLMLGSLAGFAFQVAMYTLRRLVSFKTAMSCLPDGLKVMAPAVIILTLAWTLNTMTSDLGADEFVANFIGAQASGLYALLPAVIFLVASGLAFATGTSWGTFGILIPIVIAVFVNDPTLMVVGMSACLAGAVFGDHVSPISDTTIMASAGAQCDHMNHVATQLPYAAPVAVAAFAGYVVVGLVPATFPGGSVLHPLLGIATGAILLAVWLKLRHNRQQLLDAGTEVVDVVADIFLG
ncbi:MAG: Na+/H+ antiporter NhaC family protein [Propionibacteriaceae bacterium]|jgi:Na+/H+ antiporter NhaC|nr:Na+/H+ antiporter NhaC family protein [Propionibacteriaceae bacterium]